MKSIEYLRRFFLKRKMAHGLEDSLSTLSLSEASSLLENSLTIYSIPFISGEGTLYVNNLRFTGKQFQDTHKFTFCWLNKKSLKVRSQQ